MTNVYALHSQGPEVGQIQTQLQALGWYSGAIDNDFGGGTDTAVRGFQQANGLTVDGQVGPETWQVLFPGSATAPVPTILSQPLAQRCLALTGTFETGAAAPACFSALAGNSDGQGLSFGALQWNFGQGTLQELLRQLDADVFNAVFGTDAPALQALLGQPGNDPLVAWARSIQTPGNRIDEPWNGRFVALGQTPEFQQIELEGAGAYWANGEGLRASLNLTSQRASALLFDVAVQNGGLGKALPAIQAGFATPGLTEQARMCIVANAVAEASNPKWVEDVRARKLAIANGTGTIHGRTYDLAQQYGITLDPA